MTYLYTCPECDFQELLEHEEERICPDCLCNLEVNAVEEGEEEDDEDDEIP